MRNWKTTVSGLIAAACGFVVFSPELFVRWPFVVAIAKYATIGGLATLGVTAKDHGDAK
jgi:hypothetical protein